MLDYAQVPADDGRILLLGNGFSIAYDGQFHYPSLWTKAAEEGLLSPQACAVAAELGSTNFEEVIRFLERVTLAVRAYGLAGDAAAGTLDAENARIRKALVGAIAGIHLEPPTRFRRGQVESCARFLAGHAAVFTTNYDLLLYWTLMKTRTALKEGEHGPPRRFGDGMFEKGERADRRRFVEASAAKLAHPVHYLHGALHLHEDAEGTWKRVRPKGEASAGSLKDDLRRAIEAGEMPLLVAEGDADAKLRRILSSPYLRFCLERLRLVSGPLVTFGFSFSEQDAHIAEAIASNPGIRQVYVGALRGPSGGPAADLLERVEAMRARRAVLASSHPGAYPELSVAYYDAATAGVWAVEDSRSGGA